MKNEALHRIKKEDISGSIDKTLLKIETFIDTTPLNSPFCKGVNERFEDFDTTQTDIRLKIK